MSMYKLEKHYSLKTSAVRGNVGCSLEYRTKGSLANPFNLNCGVQGKGGGVEMSLPHLAVNNPC